LRDVRRRGRERGARPDEHISITELLTATTTVACLLLDWCGVDED
jgi:acetylornithine deacetylase/succinyl-diaminopimelate desuccinylase-like protein